MVLHNEDNKTPGTISVTVDSGICGFFCCIKAWQTEKRAVGIKISESECRQIQTFSDILTNLSLKEIFLPATRNPVYQVAEQSGCHPSCPITAAVLKAAEVALEMALPLDASIRFESCKEDTV